MSVLKRQRELKKAEKAARKRARRHGVPLAPEVEPRPTPTGDLPQESESDEPDHSNEGEGSPEEESTRAE